ncbi:hypothetical protein DD549_15835 [Shewanella algae]|uniref:hypothetical protein n=1 Tax=Shewanella algae TaxID=38313 RepID=UPI000D64C074|nr:hypothetical protein [Shewanella algae]PWF90955.1 hypothetical protein DD549_15835 [Shewanella algae]
MNNQENKPHQLSLTIQSAIQGKAAKYCGLILKNPHRNTFQIGGSFRSIVEQVIPEFIVAAGTPKAQTPVFLPYSLKPVDKLLAAPKPTVPGTTEYKRSRAHDKYHFLVLDFDGTGDGDDKEITPAVFHQLLKAKGWSHWLYTTTSHDPVQGINRFRVLIPMKEGLNFTSIRDRKKTLKRYFDQMVEQAGYVSTLDRSSFSENQGFHLPQQKSQNLLFDGSPLDLMRFGKDPVTPNAPITDWNEQAEAFFAGQRVETALKWKLDARRRDEQLFNLALELTRLHGRPSEVKASLEGVIRSRISDPHKQAEHLGKVEGKVQYARTYIAKKSGFAPIPSEFVRADFVPLEQAQQAIVDHLTYNDGSILLNVTPGAGKTRNAIEWAAEQVKTRNEIIGYAVKSCSDADEVADRFKANGVIDVRVIQPRMPSNCANFTTYEAKRKGDDADRRGAGTVDQERGATIYCKSHCPVGKAGRCEYSNQTANLEKGSAVLIYKHAHLFDGKNGVKDRGFGRLDTLLIDEEILSTYSNDLKDSMSLEMLIDQVPQGSTLWRELFDSEIQTPAALNHLLNKSKHRATSKLIKDQLKRSGFDMLRHLADCIEQGKGSNGLYVYGDRLHYVRKPSFAPGLKQSARVIFLDGTGDVEILRAITGRNNLVEKRVDVDVPESVEVIQALKDGYSFSKSWYAGRPGMAEVVSRWCSDNDTFEMTNKDNADGESVYLYNQRGKNDLEQVKALAVTLTPNIPEIELETITRSVWRDSPEAISMDKDTTLEIGRGRGLAVNVFSKKQVFVDQRVRRLRDQMTKAEILQAAHRSRAIRRDSGSPLQLYIFSNEILPLTVTKVVGIDDLGLVIPNGKSKGLNKVISAADLKRLQAVDAVDDEPEQGKPVPEVDPDVVEVTEVAAVSYNDQKSMNALTRFAEAVKAGVEQSPDGFLKWKQGDVIKATGGKVTRDQWLNQFNKVEQLTEFGLTIVEQRIKHKGRWKVINAVRLIDVAA